MRVEEAIVAHLAADSGVSSLVGKRIHELILPQSPVLPAVRIQLISYLMRNHLRGDSNVSRARIQTDVFGDANKWHTVMAVGKSVHNALSGRRFNIGTPPVIEIMEVQLEDRRVMFEGNELRQVRVMQDFIVWSRQM